eukprot:817581-Pyramimonas_sp.AAC.1
MPKGLNTDYRPRIHVYSTARKGGAWFALWSPVTNCYRIGAKGERMEKVGNWTQGEKRGRVSG